MADFFVITPLGFEEFVEREIQFHLSKLSSHSKEIKDLSTKCVKGGVEFQAPFLLGLKLNNYLKMATRILYRWKYFKAYHFSELEKFLKKIDFKEHFPPSASLLFKIESKQSKLGQEKRIFEVFNNVFKNYSLYSKPSEAPKDSLKIYVDFYKDQCRISLDTSGEPLFKRHTEKWNHQAPIRETIAHWGLIKMMEMVSPWERPFDLIDPFCGSGTLLLEALNFYKPNRRPFDYEQWSSFKTQIEKTKDPDAQTKKTEHRLPFISYLGSDINTDVLQIAMQNKIFIEKLTSTTLSQLHWYQQDAFNLNQEKLVNALSQSESKTMSKDSDLGVPKKIWIYSNLPYGKRVADHDVEKIPQLFAEKLSPRIMGFFHTKKLIATDNYKSLHYPIENGGLRIYLSLLTST